MASEAGRAAHAARVIEALADSTPGDGAGQALTRAEPAPAATSPTCEELTAPKAMYTITIDRDRGRFYPRLVLCPWTLPEDEPLLLYSEVQRSYGAALEAGLDLARALVAASGEGLKWTKHRGIQRARVHAQLSLLLEGRAVVAAHKNRVQPFLGANSEAEAAAAAQDWLNRRRPLLQELLDLFAVPGGATPQAQLRAIRGRRDELAGEHVRLCGEAFRLSPEEGFLPGLYAASAAADRCFSALGFLQDAILRVGREEDAQWGSQDATAGGVP